MANEAVPIQFRGPSFSADVSSTEVFFAFPSGRLDYDCHSCGSHCCKGWGYAMHSKREVDAQIKLRPEVGLFLDETVLEERGVVGARNCPPACFFLKDSGHCQVQDEHGYSAKPETCRLFPFNDLKLAGRFLIVLPHAHLCPLTVTEGASRSSKSQHEMLMTEMQGSALGAVPQPLGVPGRSVHTCMGIERAMLDVTQASIPDRPFDEFIGNQIEDSVKVGLKEGNLIDRDKFCASLSQFLGHEPSQSAKENRLLNETLIVASPSIRIRSLFSSSGAHALASPIAYERGPLLLLALHRVLALAVDAGINRVTYQTVMKVFTTYSPLLLLSSMADQVVVLHPDAPISFSGLTNDVLPDFIKVVRGLLPRSQTRMRRTLGQVVRDSLRPRTIGRLQRLNHVATRLVGRLVPFDGQVPHSRKPRVLVQRQLLNYLPDEMLVRHYSRTGSPAPAQGSFGSVSGSNQSDS